MTSPITIDYQDGDASGVDQPSPRALTEVADPFTPIIAVEGLDGAGKNTFTNALVGNLERRGLNVGTLSYPQYGSTYADMAADALHGGQAGMAISPHAMALLFAMDRAESMDKIGELTTINDVVILDRYVASNAAYTSARRGVYRREETIQWIESLEFGTLGLPAPTLQIFLDTPREVAASRALTREAADSTRARDSYERDADLQAATGATYRHLVETQWVSEWLVYGLDPDIQGLADRIVQEVNSGII